MNTKKWLLPLKDPYQTWLSKLDERDKKLIEEVKIRYRNELYEYVYYVRDVKLDFSFHFNYTAQIEELEYQYYKIVRKMKFKKSFKNVVEKESYQNVIRKIDVSNHNKDAFNMIMINDDRFYEFVYSFGIITPGQPWWNEMPEMQAIKYLKPFVKLNVIECLISDIREWQIQGYDRFEDAPQWKKILKILGSRFDTTLKPTSKYTAIHYFMNSKGLKKNINDKEYRSTVKTIFEKEMENTKFNNFSRLDDMNEKYLNEVEKLNSILDDFIGTKKS